MRIDQNVSAKMKYVSCLFFGTALLSGCSVLPKPKPAPTIYRLSVPHDTKPVAVGLTKVVNIEYPTTSKSLAGMDIVLSPDGRSLTMASGAHWAEPVPALLQNALIDLLASNPTVTGIIPKGNTRVPYRLNMDVRRFEAVFDNGEGAAPLAMVHLNLSLTDTNTRKLVGVYSVQAERRSRAVTVSAIVDAQGLATQEAMKDISKWLSGQLGYETKGN